MRIWSRFVYTLVWMNGTGFVVNVFDGSPLWQVLLSYAALALSADLYREVRDARSV